MTIKETLICPTCRNTHGRLHSTASIMSDVRLDTLVCPQCGTEWRVYSKISECATEVMHVPQQQEPAKVTQPVAEVAENSTEV